MRPIVATLRDISSPLDASSVTTSLPFGADAWTSPPGIAATSLATRSSRRGAACTTRLAMCSSALVIPASHPRAGRTRDELEHPDQESVAGDDDHGQHRGHDDRKQEERLQLLGLRVRRFLFVHV